MNYFHLLFICELVFLESWWSGSQIKDLPFFQNCYSSTVLDSLTQPLEPCPHPQIRLGDLLSPYSCPAGSKLYQFSLLRPSSFLPLSVFSLLTHSCTVSGQRHFPHGFLPRYQSSQTASLLLPEVCLNSFSFPCSLLLSFLPPYFSLFFSPLPSTWNCSKCKTLWYNFINNNILSNHCFYHFH